jgi:hypothetical protein
MDRAEIQGRVKQSISSLAESHGFSSLNVLPSDESMLRLLNTFPVPRKTAPAEFFFNHFRLRKQPRFFAGFHDKNETVTRLRQRWPDANAAIICRAERLCEGRFSLLGFDDLNFGVPVDWHLEPVSGKRAPLKHWSKIDYLNEDIAGDKKIIWELNRHQYFNTLGQAYWLTNDEAYARAFVSHLESWIDQNPPKLGINWASSLEVGFRSISWLWAFSFFIHSNSLSPESFWRALKFLYVNARHLETYLSTYFSPNTHLTGEALALYYLGSMLPEFMEAERWKSLGRKILLEQLPVQIRNDGVYFEQSTYYHRYTVDFYTHFLLLSQVSNEVVDPLVVKNLQALLDHLMYITRPDGTTPLVGDDDGGRLVMLDQRPANDFRAALSNGASLFKRSDYKFVAGEVAEETLWLLGPVGVDEFDSIAAATPSKTSVAFRESGYFVMRDGWTRDANYALVDCGPHGAVSCGHAHADALSLDLVALGEKVFVDPGTFTYTGSAEMRGWFRSSSAHNCITINGESSSVPGGPFSWQQVAQCSQQQWISNQYFDFFQGQHDGYLRLNPAISHIRSILFLKGDYWIIRDHVEATVADKVDLWLHLAPGLTAEIVDGCDSQARTAIVPPLLALTIVGGEAELTSEKGWVSYCYGTRQDAEICRYSTIVDGIKDIFTFLIPAKNDSATPSVYQMPALNGHAFRIQWDDRTDIVLMGGGEPVHVRELELTSDFQWALLRFDSNDTNVPVDVKLLNGSRIRMRDTKIASPEQVSQALVAVRCDKGFRVENLNSSGS